jgi:4-amino-4-deoxy-L-arabinose transferase-like glycosyltransferase
MRSMVIDRKRFIFILLIFLVASLAVGLVFYSTVWGAGLISDSFQYISTAKNIVAGREFGYLNAGGQTIPLTQYPPFFSLVLVVFEATGVDTIEAARFLNAFLFGINTLLVGYSIKMISGSMGFSVVGALLVALSPTLVEAHSWVLSEPLYYCLSLLGFMALTKYLTKVSRGWLLAASILFGLGFFTRYVGLSLVVCGLCILLFSTTLARSEKLISGLTLAILSVLPIGLWTLRNYILTGTLNNRILSFTPLTPKNMLSAVNTFEGWLFPALLVNGHEKTILIAGGIILVLLLFAYLFFLRKMPYAGRLLPISRQSGELYKSHFLYIGIYFGIVVLSKVYFDDNIGFSERIFSPVLLSGLILTSAYLANLWHTDRLVLKLGATLCSIYLISFYAAGATHLVPRLHNKGIGVARKSWHNAESIQLLPAFESKPMFSNSPSSLYLWTGNTGYTINDFEAFRSLKNQEDAVLVIFHHIAINPRIERLTQGLQILVEDRVASVYLYSP